MADNDEQVDGPVEARALSAMGATFAERKAANAKHVKASSTEDKSVSKAATKAKK